MIHLQQFYGDAGIGEAHGDAATHRAGPHDGCRIYGAGLRPFVDVGDLVGLSFGEEGEAQRLRLVGVDQFLEQLTLAGAALLEGHRDGGLDAFDAVVGSVLVARAALDLLSHRVEHAGVLPSLGEPVVIVAHPRQGPHVRDFLGIGHRGVEQRVVVLGQIVQNPQRAGLGRGDVAAGDDHLQRRLRPDQPRQALRALAAR